MDIICQDCGDVRRNVRYKNTKYCGSCRLLRDMRFVRAGDISFWLRKCHDCGNEFLAIHSRDRQCGECADDDFYVGDCHVCKEKNVGIFRPAIPVCSWCLYDPADRDTIINALARGQRSRREASGYEAPDQPDAPDADSRRARREARRPSTPDTQRLDLSWVYNHILANQLKKQCPKKTSETVGEWVRRLVDLGLVQPDGRPKCPPSAPNARVAAQHARRDERAAIVSGASA